MQKKKKIFSCLFTIVCIYISVSGILMGIKFTGEDVYKPNDLLSNPDTLFVMQCKLICYF